MFPTEIKINTFALNVCGLESLNDRKHIFAEIHVEFFMQDLSGDSGAACFSLSANVHC